MPGPPVELDLSTVLEAIADTQPDAECLVFRDRRVTWREMQDRTRRLANHLLAQGLGCHRERAELADHESGQDHLAIYLHNGNEYIESMLGAWKARVAPLNVNYRYVADELIYLLRDSGATAIVVHGQFTPTLAEVLPSLPELRVILQVDDGSGHPLLPGAVWYEDALAAASPDRPPVTWSPDDLYLLYTGGTTGMPKGVMWRNGDAMIECFSGSPTAVTVEDFLRRRQHPVPGDHHPALHARCRSLGRLPGAVGRRHHPHPAGCHPSRCGRGVGDGRGRTGRLHADRRRRLRPSAARRARPPSVRPVEPQRDHLGWRGAVGRPQERPVGPSAHGDDRRRDGLVGGGRPVGPRVDDQRCLDRELPGPTRHPRAVGRPRSRAGTRRRRGRVAGQERTTGLGLSRRSRTRRRGRTRASPASGSPCPATGLGCWPTAASSCTAATQ